MNKLPYPPYLRYPVRSFVHRNAQNIIDRVAEFIHEYRKWILFMDGGLCETGEWGEGSTLNEVAYLSTYPTMDGGPSSTGMNGSIYGLGATNIYVVLFCNGEQTNKWVFAIRIRKSGFGTRYLIYLRYISTAQNDDNVNLNCEERKEREREKKHPFIVHYHDHHQRYALTVSC